MANARMSMYSLASEVPGARGQASGQQQVSTTTLLNAIHNTYLSSAAYRLDAGTSVVVNTWLTASQAGPDGREGGTVDAALAARAWEHARRRAEDGCIILGSLHSSTPSLLSPFLASFPVAIPPTVFTALSAVRPFISAVTPSNPSRQLQSALAVTLTFDLTGSLAAASLSLSQGGIDTSAGLLDVPAERGHRAFDVFYYLLTSASTPAEREFLGLKPPSAYSLLARSGTYSPPTYLPAADDGAAADDFRAALRDVGIRGAPLRGLLSTLTGLLKLGDAAGYAAVDDSDTLEELCEDAGGLLGLEPEVLAKGCSTDDRRVLVAGLYEALVDWVLGKANEAIALQIARARDAADDASATGSGDTVCITVVEVPSPALGRAIAMRAVFDDAQGINAEMAADGLEVPPAGASVVRETQAAVAELGPELGVTVGTPGRERARLLERREAVLERVAHAAEDDGFVRKLLFPLEGEGVVLGTHGRLDLDQTLAAARLWHHLCVHPTDDASPAGLAALPSVTSAWSAGAVSRQLRGWRLPEWANRRNRALDFTADLDVDEFCGRYAPLGCGADGGRDAVETWILERGWSNGEVVVGRERVWMREAAWWEAESMLDRGGGVGGIAMMAPQQQLPMMPVGFADGTPYSANSGSGYFAHVPTAGSSPGGAGGPIPMHATDGSFSGSQANLIVGHNRNHSQATLGPSPLLAAPTTSSPSARNVGNGDYGLGRKGDAATYDHYDYNADGDFVNMLDPELARGKHVEENKVSLGRRVWVAVVWALTFWIPSFLLRHVGRMRRPDVRMAWREKLVLVFFIFLINATIIFWIIFFGMLLCPNFDKAWSQTEVATHQGADDFWVSVNGKVYDISKFWRLQHSDSIPQVSADNMQPLAGLNLNDYFVAPLPLTCPGLTVDQTMSLQFNNTPLFPEAQHVSGFYARDPTSKLHNENWYVDNFLPRIKEYYHGDLVWDAKDVLSDGTNNGHMWVIYNGGIYDMTNYFYTLNFMRNLAQYNFIDPGLAKIVQNNPGTDVTTQWDNYMTAARASGNDTTFALAANSFNCIQQTFYTGKVDFRFSARCQVNNWILLAFTVILCAVILIKFLSALQFGSKRRPAPQDKFVICQVPAYTEGEDSLRKALDSLTALQYDNKRKLICVICDGVIVGQGNDRPTPKIVLDILGVDPKVDPPALPFKSVGNGAEQLNYGKVYSGLYEYEGNVVPYVVVVKVGNEQEQGRSKPGNRGKRDSQILLMSFLNRVHHRAPMNPLELEMFHQINNVIGVDPELYEYLFMVDADTSVREDSLNRLVAACANDARIAGICGETSLQNEERSWWTMIQVYEYFISHHLAKAFESLFGSVTCLPGCFCMYRLRTADRGKPLIISDKVIGEYSDINVDTLHKKNLLSLGEDRYLTTLMTKHFPHMYYKFIPDAYCQTAAPETWSVLLSQRRRWINSTIHNLAELVWLKDMCGFCCFSMRFVVFIDLAGTLILPATCVYLGYLLYRLGTHQGQFPLITLILLAAVYGLQALIFLLKRQWQHIGWMIIYIVAFPIYSFVLPIYSFWNQDNFSWGNTRIVIGEKGDRRLVAVDGDAKAFDPRSIPLQRWDDHAYLNNLPGRRGTNGQEKSSAFPGAHESELDDMRSVYSSVRGPGSVAPRLPSRGSAYGGAAQTGFARQSTFGLDSPAMLANRQSTASFGNNLAGDAISRHQSPYQDLAAAASRPSLSHLRSQSGNTLGATLTAAQRQSTATLGYSGGARPPYGGEAVAGTVPDFQRAAGPGQVGAPDDATVVDVVRAVLAEVDLDSVTKKQVRALVEQRLQTELVGERRTFMDRVIDGELANM